MIELVDSISRFWLYYMCKSVACVLLRQEFCSRNKPIRALLIWNFSKNLAVILLLFFTYLVSLHRQSSLISRHIIRETVENIRNIREPLQFLRRFQMTLLWWLYPCRGYDKTDPSYARSAWRCHPATLFWTYTNLTR